MRYDDPDPMWAERLRQRCHRELRRRKRHRGGWLIDSAAGAVVCVYLAAVLAALLRATSGS